MLEYASSWACIHCRSHQSGRNSKLGNAERYVTPIGERWWRFDSPSGTTEAGRQGARFKPALKISISKPISMGGWALQRASHGVDACMWHGVPGSFFQSRTSQAALYPLGSQKVVHSIHKPALLPWIEFDNGRAPSACRVSSTRAHMHVTYTTG